MTKYNSIFLLFITGFLVISVVLFSGNVSCEEMARTTMVEVTGTGTIRHEDDAAKARDRAISASLISAVEKVMAGLLPVDSRVANFPTINDLLYTNSPNIIQGYKVLTEDKYGNFYRVMVQVTVSVDKVQQHLALAGIVLDKKTMPSILFLISEQNLENIAVLYWWGNEMSHIVTPTETAISETLQKKGFFVIDHLTMDKNNPPANIQSFSANPDIQGAIKIGLGYQADVVIFGTSNASQSSNTIGEDIKSFIGRISLNAYRTDTGSKIASTEYSTITVNADEVLGGREALLKVGIKAGEELAPKILSAWQREAKKPSKIKLEIGGTKYLSHFEAFRKNLIQLSGVKGIQTREIESDKAVIIVNFQGNGKELANELILNTFTSFGINIEEISENHLDIDIVPVKNIRPKN